MAIAPSPAIERTGLQKPVRAALALALAFLGLFGLDALLFRTNIYPSILEPDSSSGLFELTLWRERRAQKDAGDNLAVALGDSRMGYLPKGVDLRSRQTGYALRTAVIPGSDARSWYYLLRDLDPTARRYRAIVIGLDDYYDEDSAFEPDDDIRALHYAIVRLRLRDTLDFARSFYSPSVEWEAFRGALLKGIALQSDIQAFLSHPRKRIDMVRLFHRGWPDWNYNYVESSLNMVGLRVDWGKMQATYPPGMTEIQKATVQDYLLRPKAPQTGRLRRFRLTWLGRIADRYRQSRTKIIFIRLARGPFLRPDYLAAKQTSSIRELAGRPNVLLSPEHTFDFLEHPGYFKDALHLNKDGVALFSAALADETARLLGPPRERAAR